MDLHHLLDVGYGPDGDDELRRRIRSGADIEKRVGPLEETPLHVAARRRRVQAVQILLASGAEIDRRNGGGKTAFAHAIRRGFDDVVACLRNHGADEYLTDADAMAVAVVSGRWDDARHMLGADPQLARTGNPEEDRLLADIAGRADIEPVQLLVDYGADLHTPGLDGGTPLHIACWFGQPGNARLLIDAGASLEVFDPVHHSSPLGWAVHGARYSSSAGDDANAYAELVTLLLGAGAKTSYPDNQTPAYLRRLHADALPPIASLLPRL